MSNGELEQTHFVAGKVFVFQVPKLESSEGFKAASWPKTPIWTGRLRVVSKGDKVSILLEHSDKEGLFAACPIQNEKTVEQTVDSSRYFVLRVSDGKKSAVLGIGFNDRTQAFDFKVAVQDQQNTEKAEKALASTPAVDLSLPKDGKIHINVNLGTKAKEGKAKKESNKAADGITAGLGALKIAPPPSGGSSAAPKKEKKKDGKDDAQGGATTPDDWVTF